MEVKSGGPRHGAEFIVRLPLAAEDLPVREVAPRSALRRAARGACSSSRTTPTPPRCCADLLAGAAHEVEVAPDGRSGVARARALRPDLVLCDIGLPLMDGYEVARTLRGDPHLAATLLVALSRLRAARRRGEGGAGRVPPPPRQARVARRAGRRPRGDLQERLTGGFRSPSGWPRAAGECPRTEVRGPRPRTSVIGETGQEHRARKWVKSAPTLPQGAPA